MDLPPLHVERTEVLMLCQIVLVSLFCSATTKYHTLSQDIFASRFALNLDINKYPWSQTMSVQ